jgi:hypothetical protein
MTYTGQNLEVYQGKDRIIEVTVYDGYGAPLNITGSDFTWVVYRPTPGNIVLTKTTTSGINLTVPASGLMEITLAPQDTINLLGQYNHEGEITTPTGAQDTIFTGYFKVYASKT